MSTTTETPREKTAYAWYALGLLVLAFTFSFIDRQILSLLVGPMKRDLDISDTEISLLQGLAFAIFYTLMGLPIGRLVDSKRRVTIISLGVFFWSLMTALCGVAKSYTQLFIFRMGVGVGEAALSPAAFSILSDYFKPERLGLAIGIYSIGIYIGAGLALIIGGIVVEMTATMAAPVLPYFGEIYNWQLVFLIVGLPGIPLALWVATLREPKRQGVSDEEMKKAVPWSELISYLRSNRKTLICHHLSYALVATMAYGVAAWIPEFYIRTYGWTAGTSRSGLWNHHSYFWIYGRHSRGLDGRQADRAGFQERQNAHACDMPLSRPPLCNHRASDARSLACDPLSHSGNIHLHAPHRKRRRRASRHHAQPHARHRFGNPSLLRQSDRAGSRSNTHRSLHRLCLRRQQHAPLFSCDRARFDSSHKRSLWRSGPQTLCGKPRLSRSLESSRSAKIAKLKC